MAAQVTFHGKDMPMLILLPQLQVFSAAGVACLLLSWFWNI